MATTYVIYNGPMPTTAPITPVTTSATLFTLMQIVPSANTPLKVVEWGVSFNGAALAAGFQCELVETGAIAATVTSYAVADLMPYGDPNAPANTTAGTSSVPLNMSTALSGYTSSAEGSITVCRSLDSQIVEPIGGYWKQFPLGREPGILPGHVCRIRIHGDGTTKAVCYMVIEI
jgi:hypothetical protein